MIERCWGFHASSIPETSERVEDQQGRLWYRAGARLWTASAGNPIKHESWLLREHGPVRCPVELDCGLPLTIRGKA